VTKPLIHKNTAHELLRSERVAEFNQLKAKGGVKADDLRGGDFRGLDLRELDASGLDLRDAYFRGADLRGIDFRNAQLEGASFCQAHISGCFFPKEITADEIRVSFDLGIRIRYQSRG
jgi:uncharacterized protein YjbI with pentapeptide repeats